MWKMLRQIGRTGTRSEAPPGPDEALRVEAEGIQRELLAILGRALTIREVDAGSCNGCELEINALDNPYYNLEGLGIRFVASPRHADLLLVTGPVSRHMELALRRTWEATPAPNASASASTPPTTCATNISTISAASKSKRAVRGETTCG